MVKRLRMLGVNRKSQEKSDDLNFEDLEVGDPKSLL